MARPWKDNEVAGPVGHRTRHTQTRQRTHVATAPVHVLAATNSCIRTLKATVTLKPPRVITEHQRISLETMRDENQAKTHTASDPG
jgi:hypothetical protein